MAPGGGSLRRSQGMDADRSRVYAAQPGPDAVGAADARKSQSSRMYVTLRAEPRSGGRAETDTEPLPKYSVP